MRVCFRRLIIKELNKVFWLRVASLPSKIEGLRMSPIGDIYAVE
ncbi:MAG: hypothetical protein K0S27_1528 [Gammaproteobacteria bacterium]|jgi:hypothetical protein|nr:hypothetical protein [Gammaproteobacteria bacterium]